jgi:hypothetical protein
MVDLGGWRSAVPADAMISPHDCGTQLRVDLPLPQAQERVACQVDSRHASKATLRSGGNSLCFYWDFPRIRIHRDFDLAERALSADRVALAYVADVLSYRKIRSGTTLSLRGADLNFAGSS